MIHDIFTNSIPYKLVSIEIDPTVNSKMINIHNHATVELLYIVTGNSTIYVKDEYKKVSANDLIVIPASIFHVLNSRSDNFLMLSIIFEPLCPFTERNVSGNQHPFYGNTVVITDSEPYKYLLSQMIYTLHGSDNNDNTSEKSELYTSEKIHLLFLLLMLEISQHYDKAENKKLTKDNVKQNRTKIIDSFFSLNYINPDVSKKDLSNLLFVTERQLDRILLQFYGKTFREKLFDIRIATATNLLEHTDMSLNKIAAMVGYGNTNNFITFFKRQAGITPTDFRLHKLKH